MRVEFQAPFANKTESRVGGLRGMTSNENNTSINQISFPFQRRSLIAGGVHADMPGAVPQQQGPHLLDTAESFGGDVRRV